MRYLTSFFILFILFSCEEVDSYQPGETFIKFFGTSSKEIGIDVLKVDNGYLLLGNSESGASASTIMLVKSDNKGNEEWQKVFPSEANVDRAVGMIQLEDENLVILANRNDTTGILCYSKPDGSDFETNSPIELKPSGDLNGVHFNSIERLDEGGYLVVGEVRNTNDEWDMLSMKLDNSGGIIWEKIEGYKGGGDDLGNSSSEDNSQNYYLFGSVEIQKVQDGQEITVSDMRTVRVNSLGNIVWDTQISTFENEFGVKIMNYNNDFYILGRRDVSNSDKDIIISQLESSGSAVALLEFGGDGIDLGNDMQINSDGFYIAGSSNNNSGDEDILVMKIDFQGNVIWRKTYGYEGVDFGSKILIEDDNSILIVGTGYFGNNEKICLLKIDADGNLSKL